MSEDVARRNGSRAPLWIVIALCIAPVVASYVAYYWWPPSEQVNYGELLEPRPLPDAQLHQADGSPFRWEAVKGKWALAVVDSGRCDAWCRDKLVYMRQIELAQAKEAARIERIWIIADGVRPDAQLLAAHPGLRAVTAGNDAALAAFPAEQSRADHIYVVDPLGNLMMRYPRNADPRRMLKDIARLLRHSKWR